MFDCPYSPISSWPVEKRGPYTLVVVDTRCHRIQGMQGTKSLPENTLMLFKNTYAGTYFHTRNCIPLDIVPISNSGEVLTIWTVRPDTPKVGPAPYRTSKILEAPAGWFKKKNIRVGDFVPLLNV